MFRGAVNNVATLFYSTRPWSLSVGGLSVTDQSLRQKRQRPFGDVCRRIHARFLPVVRRLYHFLTVQFAGRSLGDPIEKLGQAVEQVFRLWKRAGSSDLKAGQLGVC